MTTSRLIHYSGRPPYWKSFSGKISTIYRPINAKVVWRCRCRITLRHRSRDHNIKFSKSNMEDGRHFENGFIAISQLGIIRCQWNLVDLSRFWFRERSLSSFGVRSFATAGPRTWNKLPSHICLMQSADTFRCRLKTFLFNAFYHDIVRRHCCVPARTSP